MPDRSDEAGDPACWAHLFEDDEEDPGPESEGSSPSRPDEDADPA